jgi:hypothetical protein
VCKAPGATLLSAAPSLQPTDALDRIWFSNRSLKIRPTHILISTLSIVYSRGIAAALTGHSEDITLPMAKGGIQHEQRPSMLLRACTLLKTVLALLLPRRSLSCVG